MEETFKHFLPNIPDNVRRILINYFIPLKTKGSPIRITDLHRL
jgi:hypothetical protein